MQILEANSARIIAAACDYLGKEAKDYKRQVMPENGKFPDTPGYYRAERERYDRLIKDLKKPVLITAFHLAVAQFVYPSFYHLLKKFTKQGATLKFAYRLCKE